MRRINDSLQWFNTGLCVWENTSNLERPHSTSPAKRCQVKQPQISRGETLLLCLINTLCRLSFKCSTTRPRVSTSCLFRAPIVG